MDIPPDLLSRSLSLTGTASDPQADPDSAPDDKLLPMLGLMFLGYELPALAARLAELDDGLPLPQVFGWDEPVSVDEQLQLDPEELKTLLVFEQILKQQRKSGNYFQRMKALAERHALPELELMLLSYLTQWLPAEADQRFAAQLAAHPDWLLLRCLWATRVLLHAPIEQLPLALVVFLERMDDKLELHLHSTGPLRADLVNAFYYATALLFIHTDQPERALYSLNVLEQTGPREGALKLLDLLLRRVDAKGQRERLQAFVAPFRAERMQALKARRDSGTKAGKA